MFTFKLTRSSQLIELLAGVQVVGLAIALVCGASWVKSKVGAVVRRQIIADNQLIAQQFGRVIELSNLERIEYESASWNTLQNLVENIRLPNEGYVCIAESDSGKLLCHPKLRTIPLLRESLVGKYPMMVAGKLTTVQSAVQNSPENTGRPITGTLAIGAGVEIVSATDLGDLQAILLVHQNEGASKRAVNKLLAPLSVIALVVGLGLIVCTTKVSVSILKRYENDLASINRELEARVLARTQSLMRTRDAVIFGLAKLSESRDSDTGEHLDRIRFYSDQLAGAMNARGYSIPPQLVSEIGLAASLHDIGKVGVPDHVLLKPASLSPEERSVIETHTLLGERCLDAIEAHLGQDGFLNLAKEIAAYHHEKWDGSGYPYGLIGEQIPIAARIVAVADVYDALRSRRPYKEPMSHQAACEIILKGAGKHFDPQVVEAFLACNAEFEEHDRERDHMELLTTHCCA